MIAVGQLAITAGQLPVNMRDCRIAGTVGRRQLLFGSLAVIVEALNVHRYSPASGSTWVSQSRMRYISIRDARPLDANKRAGTNLGQRANMDQGVRFAGARSPN